MKIKTDTVLLVIGWVVIAMIAFCFFMAIKGIVEGGAKPVDPVVKGLLDSLRQDVKVLQDERAGFIRDKNSVRSEITALRADKLITDSIIAKYQIELKSIKSQYAKISNRYRDISADSTQLLFNRAFDY